MLLPSAVWRCINKGSGQWVIFPDWGQYFIQCFDGAGIGINLDGILGGRRGGSTKLGWLGRGMGFSGRGLKSPYPEKNLNFSVEMAFW